MSELLEEVTEELEKRELVELEIKDVELELLMSEGK